jgi:trans-aconitate methyltransferase
MSLPDPAPNDEEWDDPFEIDTSVAHPARRYNYWLGGKDNFEADRISGDSFAAAFPTIQIAAKENRCFLHRAVTYLVKEARVRQFLDVGTGIPAANNVHEVAQSIAPESRVVYVDNDPIVLAHARRLLASAPGGATAYIQADVREPDAILDDPDLRATLDLSKPVALLLIAVAQFVPEADKPYDKVARLAGALAPGSYLAMSHPTTDFLSAEDAAAVDAAASRESARSRGSMRTRDKAEFAQFFEGMELVDPGIAALPDWRGELPPGERLAAADVSFYGGLARIR